MDANCLFLFHSIIIKNQESRMLRHLSVLSIVVPLLLLGCSEKTSIPTSINSEPITQSPFKELFNLPERQDSLTLSQFSVTETITKDKGGRLRIVEEYEGGPHGLVKIDVDLKIDKNTITEDEIDITMFVDEITGDITFSPTTTFTKPAKLIVKFSGLDLYNVNPDDIDFICQTENNEYKLKDPVINVNINQGSILLKADPFIVDNAQIQYQVLNVPNSRWGWVRRDVTQ